MYGPEDVHGPVQLEPDRTPAEYKATGERVPLSAFSVPYEGPRPTQGMCLICMEELDSSALVLVAARCSEGHLFHGCCLDKWVNVSAMDNANLCPHDRERLCDPRPRIHLGDISYGSDAAEALVSSSEDSNTDLSDPEASDSDHDIDMDISDSYHESSDVDAEGSDDESMDMDINGDEACVEELDEAALVQFLQSDEDFVY